MKGEIAGVNRSCPEIEQADEALPIIDFALAYFISSLFALVHSQVI
jgi:hypothetical protein